ncbi:hydroxysqualene dehydroxylase HpnE [Terracidiphilus gabretensis]|uniref:hydroxysqualene dehydroxylase HpnE n=1 Tax=Terracidiphilus gabretensis TaxID=1577687 RepID=UPI00071BCDB1|nr:hydroxysqualene dehydroxylase HpnE [Terracidiphilus gabretensis]
MTPTPPANPKTVAVIGGGVAGMSAACALAEGGLKVILVERRNYLGGRASSYLHPGVNEVIDNCEHALIGAYTNLRGFYRRIGVEDKIHWSPNITMIEPDGHRTILGPSPLPAPLHGLPRLLAAHAFSFADKLALARAFTAMLRPVPADSKENLAEWLKRHGQTKGAIERFWKLVIASALNSDLDRISVQYATMVIRGLFMDSPEAGMMGASTVPLSDLHKSAEQFLNAHGSSVLYNTNVESLEWDEETSTWTIHTRNSPLIADHVILALPFEALSTLLPNMPPAKGVETLADQIAQHEHWPICSVHLWFDREITELESAVLLDREIHWLYNKGLMQPWSKVKGSYIELVISASHSFAALERKEAIDLAVSELKEFFPAAREAKLEKAALIKEVRATFGVPPGIDQARPNEISPWPNCYLAGDWIATGWPSTMESAARAGHQAAETLSNTMGNRSKYLEADIKPRGLMSVLNKLVAKS